MLVLYIIAVVAYYKQGLINETLFCAFGAVSTVLLTVFLIKEDPRYAIAKKKLEELSWKCKNYTPDINTDDIIKSFTTSLQYSLNITHESTAYMLPFITAGPVIGVCLWFKGKLFYSCIVFFVAGYKFSSWQQRKKRYGEQFVLMCEAITSLVKALNRIKAASECQNPRAFAIEKQRMEKHLKAIEYLDFDVLEV